MKMKSLLAGLGLMLVGSSANAAVTVFNNFGSWFNAVSSVSSFIATETFSANTVTAPGLTISSDVGFVGSNRFNDRVSDLSSTTFGFGGNEIAFGGRFNLRPAGAGTGLTLTLLGPGSTVVDTVSIPNTYNGWFGILSTETFTSIRVSAGFQQGVAETYRLDNLSFASGVPEMSTWLMMLVGFGGLGMVARRRQIAA